MLNRFFSYVRQSIDSICNRPDHLQRLAIAGAGMAIYPLVVAAFLVMWLGFGQNPDLLAAQARQIDWIGWFGVGFLMLLALVIVTMLGTIKGISISGPGGVEVQVETSAGDGEGLSDDRDDGDRRRSRRDREDNDWNPWHRREYDRPDAGDDTPDSPAPHGGKPAEGEIT